MGYESAHLFYYNKPIADYNQMGPAEKKHYKQVLSTEAHYLPPLHSPVVRLTCNQQVLSSNLRGGSTHSIILRSPISPFGTASHSSYRYMSFFFPFMSPL